MSATPRLRAVETDTAIGLTRQEAQDAAGLIGLALHLNPILCDLTEALRSMGGTLGLDAELPDTQQMPAAFLETAYALQARLYEAADDPQGVAAALLTRAALSLTASDGPGVPDSPPELPRAQQAAVDRVESEYGRCVVKARRDGAVEVTALLDDMPMYTACVEPDGSQRWRR